MVSNALQFYPGALYMISQFYTRKEVATRMAIFYTGNMLASAFSGLIAAGIFAGLDVSFFIETSSYRCHSFAKENHKLMLYRELMDGLAGAGFSYLLGSLPSS